MNDNLNDVLLHKLVDAINGRNLEDLVGCFAADYVNETPAHPERGFRGREGVRHNWTQLFATVPDLHAEVPRTAVHGEELWTEWEISGTRTDNAPFHLRGVVIYRTRGSQICSARFFLEPVEHVSGDRRAALSAVLGLVPPSSHKEEPS